MPLTDGQINQLADELVGTDCTPERVAAELFGDAEVDADLEARLRGSADLHRCHECECWVDADDMNFDCTVCDDCDLYDDCEEETGEDDEEEEDSDDDTGEYPAVKEAS